MQDGYLSEFVIPLIFISILLSFLSSLVYKHAVMAFKHNKIWIWGNSIGTTSHIEANGKNIQINFNQWEKVSPQLAFAVGLVYLIITIFTISPIFILAYWIVTDIFL